MRTLLHKITITNFVTNSVITVKIIIDYLLFAVAILLTMKPILLIL